MFRVTVMCRILDVSRAGFYAWRKRPPSKRQQANENLGNKIRVIHGESRGTYGSPRVHAELKAQGVNCSRKRVERLMRKDGVQARTRERYRVRTTDSAHKYPVADNLLDRKFSQVRETDRVWVGDITYIPTQEGWLYLATVLDLASRRVVGWCMQDTLERRITVNALTMALQGRNPVPGTLLHHSDRGSQYACGDYQELLRGWNITCSMSRKGDCWDNAPAESFNATIKTELIHRVAWETHTQARSAIFEYIEVWYNRRRRHSSIGYASPAEYECVLQRTNTATASALAA
jgi:transposase InsO family protein